MNRPERPAIPDREVLQQHIGAVDRQDELRPQRHLFVAEDSLLDRYAIQDHLVKSRARPLLALFPWPPWLAIAQQHALAGDRNVAAVARIDQRRIVVALLPAPAHKHRRQIIRRVAAESKLRP